VEKLRRYGSNVLLVGRMLVGYLGLLSLKTLMTLKTLKSLRNDKAGSNHKICYTSTKKRNLL